MPENETAGPVLIDTPGQDLSELFGRMSGKDVTAILGHDLVAVLNVMPGIADRLAAKRSVGVRLLQDSADDLLSLRHYQEATVRLYVRSQAAGIGFSSWVATISKLTFV